MSRRWAGTTAVHRTVIIAGKNQQLLGNNTNSWHYFPGEVKLYIKTHGISQGGYLADPGLISPFRGCSINSLVNNLAIKSRHRRKKGKMNIGQILSVNIWVLNSFLKNSPGYTGSVKKRVLSKVGKTYHFYCSEP